MKYLLLPFLFLLVGCGDSTPETLDVLKGVNTGEEENFNALPRTTQETSKEVFSEFQTSKQNMLVLQDFTEPQTISSPLRLKGIVPSSWVFEGVFPVTLLTDRGEIVREWYATADIFNESGDFIDGPVFFDLNLDFIKPVDQLADFGILKFAKANMSDDETLNDSVEIKVLFE